MTSFLPVFADVVTAAPSEDLGKVGQIFRTFGVHGTLFVSQLVSFLMVCFLLHRFAYEPILKLLDERRERIAAGEIKLREVEQKLAENEKETAAMLEKASSDAQRMIDEARSSATALSERKALETDNEIQRRLAKAEEAVAAERSQMMTELKGEFGRLVTSTTGKVTGKVMTDEDQRRINEEAVATIQS